MVMTYDLSENSKHRKTIKFPRISTGIASALKFLFGPRQSILELGSLDRNNTRFEMCPICQYCALCVEKKDAILNSRRSAKVYRTTNKISPLFAQRVLTTQHHNQV